MIDIKFIREHAEEVKANCVRRGFPIDPFLSKRHSPGSEISVFALKT